MVSSPDLKSAVLRDLAPTTGRNLDEWIRLIRRKGPRQIDGLVLWLENDQGLGHVMAQILADVALGGGGH